jgi:tRNA pseudouridine38-40 synthase
MSLIKLKLEYDGTDFVGWQFQNNGRSVQEEVEKAIKQILQAEVRVAAGGRTDAGVHARGQVASFSIEREVEVNRLAKSLNAVLPHDVVVREASEVPLDFNARYSAKKRQYIYYIKEEPTAVQRNYCWQVFSRLDIEVMKRCAEIIQGEHDFSSFSKANADVQHHKCIIYSAVWGQQNDDLTFEITANRFLYGMVRALVGTMVNVGRSHTKREEFERILIGKNRAFAGMSAPSKGLFLEGVIY